MAPGLKWDTRLLDMAELVSSWSKDPSTKVGAVISDDKHRVVAVGYNGFPRGIEDSEERYADRETKYKHVVHAETNAVLNATRSVEGCMLYISLPPCSECAKLVIQSGISRVAFRQASPDRRERWRASMEAAVAMLEEANVEVVIYD